MATFESTQWRLFVSRPTSILKRDFLKWAYLSITRIEGFRLSKVLVIGDYREQYVYINRAEDLNNQAQIRQHYRSGRIEKVLCLYNRYLSRYPASTRGTIERCLKAMKEIGSAIIYTYYVEDVLGTEPSDNRTKALLALNALIRDRGAKIVYPLYEKTLSAMKKKYPNRELEALTIEEICSPGKVVSRRSHIHRYVFCGTAMRTRIYVGKAAQRLLRSEGFTETKTSNTVRVNTISGLAASHGCIRGNIRIVHGLEDVMQCRGKIVTTPDSVIEYTPYLKRNLAIVTDFGGLSSHAAVTAREFAIPCIVGTKIATKVLKDGDLVEVDAERGVVKIIKRAEN